MSDRLAVHCASLRVSCHPNVYGSSAADAIQAIDWDAADQEAPNAYSELLVKETATLHKVLSKYLAQSTVEVSSFI